MEQLTVGTLLEALRPFSSEARVRLLFCGLAPTVLESYRGYYEQLAFGWVDPADGNEYPTVAEVRGWLRDATKRSFTGWKGGTYSMTADTPLWVDNPGSATGTALVGVAGEYDADAVLLTETELRS